MCYAQARGQNGSFLTNHARVLLCLAQMSPTRTARHRLNAGDHRTQRGTASSTTLPMPATSSRNATVYATATRSNTTSRCARRTAGNEPSATSSTSSSIPRHFLALEHAEARARPPRAAVGPPWCELAFRPGSPAFDACVRYVEVDCGQRTVPRTGSVRALDVFGGGDVAAGASSRSRFTSSEISSSRSANASLTTRRGTPSSPSPLPSSPPTSSPPLAASTPASHVRPREALRASNSQSRRPVRFYSGLKPSSI